MGCAERVRNWRDSKAFYCNKDLIAPLTKAFQNLIKTGFVNELKHGTVVLTFGQTWQSAVYVFA